MTLYRFSFCPPSHYHATAQDAANCSVLDMFFGPLDVPEPKRRNQCAESGCVKSKVYQRAYCGENLNARNKAARASMKRKGDW